MGSSSNVKNIQLITSRRSGKSSYYKDTLSSISVLEMSNDQIISEMNQDRNRGSVYYHVLQAELKKRSTKLYKVLYKD